MRALAAAAVGRPLHYLFPRDPDLCQRGLYVAASSISAEWQKEIGKLLFRMWAFSYSSVFTTVFLLCLCVMRLDYRINSSVGLREG